MNEFEEFDVIDTATETANDVAITQNSICEADGTVTNDTCLNPDTDSASGMMATGCAEPIEYSLADGSASPEDVNAAAIDDVVRIHDADGNVPDTDIANDHNADASKPSFGSRLKHLYCPVCGHEWYSPDWPRYCPKSGCLGSPKEI